MADEAGAGGGKATAAPAPPAAPEGADATGEPAGGEGGTKPEPGGDKATQGKTEPNGEQPSGTDERSTGETAQDDGGAEPEQPAQGEFRDKVNAIEPEPSPPDAIRALNEPTRQTGDEAAATAGKADKAAKEIENSWSDPAGQAAVTDAQKAADDARTVANEAESLAGRTVTAATQVDNAVSENDRAIREGDTIFRQSQALLSPEEGQATSDYLAAETAQGNKQVNTATAANIRQVMADPEEPDDDGPSAPEVLDTILDSGAGDSRRPGAEGAPSADGWRALGDAASWAGRTFDDAAGQTVETATNTLDNATEWLGDLTGNDRAEDVADALTPERAEALGNRVADGVLEMGAQTRNDMYQQATEADGKTPPVVVYFDEDRHKEALRHVREAKSGMIWAGKQVTGDTRPTPDVLTVDKDKAEKNARRTESMRGIPYGRDVGLPGYDRDEYPPAMSVEGGRRHENWSPSVKLIPADDNQAAGRHMGNATRNLQPGDQFVIRGTD